MLNNIIETVSVNCIRLRKRYSLKFEDFETIRNFLNDEMMM